MAMLAGFERLLGWRRRRPGPGSVDPADVGTAYGMELRLDARNDTSAAAGRGGLHDKREAAGTHAPPRMT